MPKRALITGITGQDGSYLAELLLGNGYEVHGLIRRSSSFNTERIDHIYQEPHEPNRRLFLHYGDVTDGANLRAVLTKAEPCEVYNLAAQSHVRVSFDQPIYTAQTVAIGALRLLEAIRDIQLPVRLYQASSSEMFGNAPAPQNEETPFAPRSPYAASKVFAHQMVRNYRDAYGLFAACGILFNHESPRRGETFVTRKITRAATRIAEGLQEKLFLGNVQARRDWGFAGDYVRAMWLMLRQPEPDDYVIATGESHTVEEFCDLAFGLLDLDWREHVQIDPRYLRPTEADNLCGDSRKARRELSWRPQVDFRELVRRMIDADWQLAKQEKLLAAITGREACECSGSG